MNKKTIILAGGGTGGHVFPVEAVARYIHTHHAEQIQQMIWCGHTDSLEHERCQALMSEGLPLRFISISSGKFRRQRDIASIWRNIRDIAGFLWGCVQSFRHMWGSRDAVMFCKGGHVALPVVCAARSLRIPIVVHESDTSAGLVNRIASKFARYRFVGFDGALPDAQVVGQLLNNELLDSSSNMQLHDFLSTQQDKTICLVVGGSQGSKTIYESLADQIGTDTDIAYIIALGRENAGLRERFAEMDHVYTQDFFSKADLGYAMRHSDIAITRGGTTFLAELKLFGLRLIIIPLPRTHDQFDNAAWYVEQYRDICLDQRSGDFDMQLRHTLDKHIGYHASDTQVSLQDLQTGVQQVCHALLK